MSNTVSRLLQAITLHRQGQTAQAKALYAAILHDDPHQGDALHLRGLIARQEGDDALAVQLISRALRQVPHFAEGYNNLGNALRGIGRESEASQAFLQALILRPDLMEAWNNLAVSSFARNDVPGGLRMAQAACLLEPGASPSWFNQGRAWASLARPAMARACFERALLCQPGVDETLHLLAGACFDGDDEPAALATLRQGPAYGHWSADEIRQTLKTCFGEPAVEEQAGPLLSIVIPTYARQAFLAALLESLLPQVDALPSGRVEVIVNDNHSHDGTARLCQELRATRPFFSYFCNPFNAGGQINVTGGVLRSRGRWTWIIGDDDLVLPGTLTRVLARLETEERLSALMLNKKVCSADLQTTLLERQFTDAKDTTYDSLLAMARAKGLLTSVSFLSTMIFRTAPFRAGDIGLFIAMGTYYPHLGLLLRAFHDQPCGTLWEPGVIQRVFNMRHEDNHAEENATITYKSYLNILRMFLYFQDAGIMNLAELETIPEEHLPIIPGQRGQPFTWAELVIEGCKQWLLKSNRARREDLFTMAHLSEKFTLPANRAKMQRILHQALRIDSALRALMLSA